MTRSGSTTASSSRRTPSLSSQPVPSQTISGKALSSQPLSGETAPSPILSNQALSSQAALGKTVAGRTLSSQAVAGTVISSQPLSGQTLSRKALSGETAPSLSSQADAGPILSRPSLSNPSIPSQAVASQTLSRKALPSHRVGATVTSTPRTSDARDGHDSRANNNSCAVKNNCAGHNSRASDNNSRSCHNSRGCDANSSDANSSDANSSDKINSGRSSAIQQRNRRVERYRDLVRPLAMHYARCCSETREDLIQVGLLGLIRAAELYRNDLGTPFEAFARPHIRGAILHYLRDEAPSVRLPRRQAELQERIRRLQNAPEEAVRSGEELRGKLGIDRGQWSLLMQHRHLSRPLPLEGEQLEELAAPEREECVERLVPVGELLRRLDPRQREVVQQVVLAGCSYRKLAAQMKVSPMTVQRLLHRGLERLRQQLEPPARLRAYRLDCRGGSGLPAC